MNKTIEQIEKELKEDELFDEYLEYSGLNEEHRQSELEARKIQPIGLDFIAKKRELREEIDKINIRVDSLKRDRSIPQWFYNVLFNVFYKDKLESLQKQYKRFDFYDKKYNKKQNVISYDLDILKSSIPIDEILDVEWQFNTSKRAKCLCPFHHEKTPSFVWYKENNTSHCFGCGFHGSVLDVYMKLNNCNFKTAVKDLNKML